MIAGVRNGNIVQYHGAWYLRVCLGRKQRAFRLGHRREFMNKQEVRRSADEQLLKLRKASNKGRLVRLDEFLRLWYLTLAREQVRPSTFREYKGMYERYIRGREEATLRLWEYDTSKCQRLLQVIAEDHDLSKTSLQHIKHFLSGAFRAAALGGLRDGNPVTLCRIPRSARPATRPPAYDLNTVKRVLSKLRRDKQAVAAVSVAAYAGLRLNEIAGLSWTDYAEGELTVRRTRTSGVEGLPKSLASGASVPVIEPLAKALSAYFASNHISSPRIFDCDLVALGRRRVAKAFRAVGAEWKGWHCFRRGLASTLFSLGVDDLTVQKILRHSEVVVTRESYIRVKDAKVQSAMERLSKALAK